MIYELFLLPRAETDVENIIRYLADRSPQGAISWRERWEQVLDQLRTGPLECGMAPESADYDAEVHQLLFKTRRGRTYRAIFTVSLAKACISCMSRPGPESAAKRSTATALTDHFLEPRPAHHERQVICPCGGMPDSTPNIG